MPYRYEDEDCWIFCVLKAVAAALAIGLITISAFTFGMIRNFHGESEDHSGSKHINDARYSSNSSQKLSNQFRKLHESGKGISMNKDAYDEDEYTDNDDTSWDAMEKDSSKFGQNLSNQLRKSQERGKSRPNINDEDEYVDNDDTSWDVTEKDSSKLGQKLSNKLRKSQERGKGRSTNKGAYDKDEYTDNDDTSSEFTEKDSSKSGQNLTDQFRKSHERGKGRSNNKVAYNEDEYTDNNDIFSYGTGKDSFRLGKKVGIDGEVNNAPADYGSRTENDKSSARWRGKGQLTDDDDDYEYLKPEGTDKCKPFCPAVTCIDEECEGSRKKSKINNKRSETNSENLADEEMNIKPCLPTCKDVCNK